MSSMKTGLILLGIAGLVLGVGSVVFPDGYTKTFVFRLVFLLALLNMTLCAGNQCKLFFTRCKAGAKGTLLRTGALAALHCGIVLIILGGMFYYFSGVRGQVPVPEGEQVDVNAISLGKIPYALRLDKFYMDFYPDGSASQYNADITLLKDQIETAQGTTRMNAPFQAHGAKFYISKYGYGIQIKTTSSTELRESDYLGKGESFLFSGTQQSLEIVDYLPNYDPAFGNESKTERPDNPRVLYYMRHEGQEKAKLQVAGIQEWIKVDEDLYFQFAEVKPYVLITYKFDPGLPVVALGGILLLGGAGIVFMKGKRN